MRLGESGLSGEDLSGLGVKVVRSGVDKAEVLRRTRETEIRCRIDAEPRRSWRICTGINFLDHMLEILAFYSGFNLDVEVKASRKLLHTIIEDVGITLGKAFHVLASERVKAYGIKGFGFSQGILDEAFSDARISFEGRVGCYIDRDQRIRSFELVEDVDEKFLESFFQGFSQGMRATIHVDLRRGDDPHHLWESAFRAFGGALREALSRDEWKKGSIAGIKETID